MISLFSMPVISGDKETTILFFTAIFLFVVSLILLLLEKSVKKKIKELSLNKTFFYTRQIKEIKKYSVELDAKQLLTLTNAISKSFFKDYLGLQRETTYEELAEEFDRRSDQKKAKICRDLSEIVYSRENVEKESIMNILDELEEMITSEGVISEHTKKRKEISKKAVKEIKTLFKEGMRSANKRDMKKAKEIYIRIVKLYRIIDLKSKAKLQGRLLELYKKVSNV